MIIKKPLILEEDIWCNNPAPGNITQPSQDKINRGFVFTEIPENDEVNWVDNLITHTLAYINQRNISQWDDYTNYTTGSVVYHNDSFWISNISDNLNHEPGTGTEWSEKNTSLSGHKDVEFTSLANNDIMYYNEADRKWKNDQLASPLILGILKDTDSIDFVQSNYASFGIDNTKTEQINVELSDTFIGAKLGELLQLSGDKIYLNNNFVDIDSIGVDYNSLSQQEKETLKDCLVLTTKTKKGVFKLDDDDFLKFDTQDIQENSDTQENSEIQLTPQPKYLNKAIFTISGTFTVPSGVTQVAIYAAGGGGSGAVSDGSDSYSSQGGGYAGQKRSKTQIVIPGEVLTITIGKGGESNIQQAPSDGESGGETIVTNSSGTILTAKGGPGGTLNSTSYYGNGAGIIGYNNQLYFDGLAAVINGIDDNYYEWTEDWVWSNTYGGQCSFFSHGASKSGKIALYGAGGSAVNKDGNFGDRVTVNKGADGICIIEY